MNFKQDRTFFNLRIKPSLTKLCLVAVLHVLPFMVLIIFYKSSTVNFIYIAVFIFCLIASLIYFVKLHLNQNLNKSIKRIQRKSNNLWYIDTHSNVNLKVDIADTSYVSNILIILNVIDDSHKHYTALITADSVNKEQFRKLKVFINTHKLKVDNEIADTKKPRS